jgi:uncharacterized membrane protein YbhN (UPF0104 family)
MKNVKEFIWPIIGLAAVVVSCWLLYRELRGISLADVWMSLVAIPPHRYALSFGATLLAYAALAWYDRIALLHLGVRHVSWFFVSVTSFTTYALSHNIGASVFSGRSCAIAPTRRRASRPRRLLSSSRSAPSPSGSERSCSAGPCS